MNRFWRNLLAILVGFLCGGCGAFPVAVFWPLLFPQPLQGSTLGVDAAPLALLASYAFFGVAGFLLCRRLTRRFVRDDSSTTVLFR